VRAARGLRLAPERRDGTGRLHDLLHEELDRALDARGVALGGVEPDDARAPRDLQRAAVLEVDEEKTTGGVRREVARAA